MRIVFEGLTEEQKGEVAEIFNLREKSGEKQEDF
jgi:hypothetical protein